MVVGRVRTLDEEWGFISSCLGAEDSVLTFSWH